MNGSLNYSPEDGPRAEVDLYSFMARLFSSRGLFLEPPHHARLPGRVRTDSQRGQVKCIEVFPRSASLSSTQLFEKDESHLLEPLYNSYKRETQGCLRQRDPGARSLQQLLKVGQWHDTIPDLVQKVNPLDADVSNTPSSQPLYSELLGVLRPAGQVFDSAVNQIGGHRLGFPSTSKVFGVLVS